MELKVRIIMNPSSGRQTIRQTVDDIVSYLVDAKALYRADYCFTRAKDDALHFAAEHQGATQRSLEQLRPVLQN